MLSQLIENHREIISYRHRVESAENNLRQSIGEYLPSVDFTGDAGREEIQKESATTPGNGDMRSNCGAPS